MEHALLNQIGSTFTPATILKLGEELIEDIAGETDESKLERASCVSKQESLKSALGILKRLDRGDRASRSIPAPKEHRPDLKLTTENRAGDFLIEGNTADEVRETPAQIKTCSAGLGHLHSTAVACCKDLFYNRIPSPDSHEQFLVWHPDFEDVAKSDQRFLEELTAFRATPSLPSPLRDTSLDSTGLHILYHLCKRSLEWGTMGGEDQLARMLRVEEFRIATVRFWDSHQIVEHDSWS